MAQEKAYLVKLENGEELGPIDQETLIKQTENGTITAGAQIRSTLIPIWMKPSEVDCLKKLMRGKQQHLAEAAAQNKWAKLKAQVELRGDYDPIAATILQEGLSYHKPAFLVRILAAVIDLAVTALFGILLMFLCLGLQMAGILPHSPASFYLLSLLVWLGAAFYFMITLNRTGQTWGMRFWGLVALTSDFSPIYFGRAVAYFICWALLGILSPVVYLLSGFKLTLQELFCGLRVKRIVVARKQYQ
jgi:uncharacterized RDD family membrane protein YckC